MCSYASCCEVLHPLDDMGVTAGGLVMQAHLDYLTLTSWEDYAPVVETVTGVKYSHVFRNGENRGGYHGFKYGGYWYGRGYQKPYGHTYKEPHYMFVASGGSADSVRGTEIMYYDWTCTRMDVQVTGASTFDARRLFDLRKVYGIEKAMTLIENSDGGETLYIGSRKSEAFWRYYKKEEKGEDFYRLEVELKGGRAKNYFVWLQGGGTPKDVYVTEFLRLPGYLQRRLNWYIMNLDGNKVLPSINETYGLDRAMAYLQNVVKPFLGNAMGKLGIDDKEMFKEAVELAVRQTVMFSED